MEAEWSVAAGVEDPIIVVPWSDDSGIWSYTDLRGKPEKVGQIPEAARWPELRSALLRLNAEAAGTWTSKCDVWELTENEKSLDFGRVNFGMGSYFDILSARPEQFASLEEQVDVLQQMTKRATKLSLDDARADFILRPAWNRQVAGFGTTAYVYGYGDNLTGARKHWAAALDAIVQLILDEMFKQYSKRIPAI